MSIYMVVSKIGYKTKEKAMANIYYKENKITSQNIDDFKNFIAQTAQQNKENPKQASRISGVELSEDVALKDFFSKDMSDEYKQETEIILARSLSDKCSPEHRQQLLEMINTNPQFVGRVFSIAGNSYNSSYSYLMDGLGERTIGENLKLYDGLLKSGYSASLGWYMEGQHQPIKHLTPEQKQIISGWSNLDKHASDKTDLASAYMRDLLERGILLNCDNLPEEVRKQVNQYALASNDKEKGWKNLDSRFMDKEFLKELLNKREIDRPQGEIPQYYTNIRDALIRAAEKAPKYDASNYGKEMTLSKRMQSVIADIKGQSYNVVEKNRASVLFEAFVTAAQKDITAGRAAELDATALEEVLCRDKDNYYIRKIPTEVIQREKLNLTSQQREILGVSQVNKMADYSAASFAEQAATSKTLNRAEKDKVSSALNEMISNKALKLQSAKQKQEEKNQDDSKLGELSIESNKAASALKTIQEMQQLYTRILSSLKDGKPNTQEKDIINLKQAEKVISDVLAGKSAQMAYPEQKSLPLLFGRKEEEQRRKRLDRAIRDFNEGLKNVNANREELKQYSGNVLSKETLETASLKRKEAGKMVRQMLEQMDHKWQLQDIDIKSSEYMLKRMKEAKNKILERKQQIQDLAKENMSTDGEKIEDVSHLQGEEKHKARAANKAKGKDKLAEKEKISKEGKESLTTIRAKKLEDIKYNR